MECIEDFLKECCEIHSEEEVLLETDFEKIKINVNDTEYSELRCLRIENVIRFLNPKVRLDDSETVSIEEDLPQELDFDEMVKFLEENSEKRVYENISDDQKIVFFLPTQIEKRIKTITCNGQTRNIDCRLQQVLPLEFIEKKKLEFKQKGIVLILLNMIREGIIHYRYLSFLMKIAANVILKKLMQKLIL